jgi:hypothetical protein
MRAVVSLLGLVALSGCNEATVETPEQWQVEQKERAQHNAQLKVGDEFCWIWAYSVNWNLYRSAVAGIQRERGTALIRITSTVYWGGTDHLAPVNSATKAMWLSDFTQVECHSVEIEGEQP